MKRNLEIHIGELVLDGLAPGGERAVAAALERELGRLLTQEGATLSSDRGVARLSVGEITLPRDAGGAAAGVAVARAVHARLGR